MRANVATHGYGGYTNGCRCETCRAAKRQYMRDKRAKASQRRIRTGNRRFIAEGITHGTYAGYADAQCRCYLCSAAKADQDRKGRTDAHSTSVVRGSEGVPGV
jgi:hypothetical protein